jgi:hypothetical protein
MAVLEHGKAIAQLIIQNQDLMERLKAAYPMPMPVAFEFPATLTFTPTYVFKELPKGLSYYYSPHQTKTVKAGERVTVWSFKVPPNHIFHIEYIGTNWYPDTYLLLIVDGSQLDKWERFVGEINAPLNVKGRFIFAKQEVNVIAVNNSTEDVIYDILIDGSVYLSEDFFEAARRGLLV